MSATAWGAAAFALTGRMVARAGYRSAWDDDPAAAADIPVYFATEAALIGDRVGTFLVVAFPGDPDTPAEGGQTGQVVATMPSPRVRAEDGVIRCLVVDQRGDIGEGVAAASISAALDVLDDVDVELRVAPTLGLSPPFASFDARLGGLPSIRPMLGGGVVTWIEFDVLFTARI